MTSLTTWTPLLALDVNSNSCSFTLLAVFLSVTIVKYSAFSLYKIPSTTSSFFKVIAFTPLALTPTRGISSVF